MKLLCSFSMVAVLVSPFIGCDRLVYGAQTNFSSGFSERRFKQIKDGMSANDVLALIGNPLKQSTQQWSEVWSYWPPRLERSPLPLGSGTNTFDLFGKVSHLHFSELGVVSAMSGDFLEANLVGHTKRQVKEEIGEPSRVKVEEFRIIFSYSERARIGNGTFRSRQVWFDSSNRVVSVFSFVHYD